MTDPRPIEEQLKRISASHEFRKCSQLVRFLRFIVSEAISGRNGGSKERLIGIEVFGRVPDYDAGIDPVVRVEARRLRRKLAEYYARAGREDPLEIRLPKGGYLPAFEVKRSRKRAVAVRPFSGHALCDGLSTRLIAQLSGCSGLQVFRLKNDPPEDSLVELMLQGSVRHAGERFRCDAQLVSCADGLHLWADSFDCSDPDVFAVEDAFAGRIARGICKALSEDSSLQ